MKLLHSLVCGTVIAGFCFQVLPADAGEPSTPRRVFVVNTGEGTVSLVDVKAMKEVNRYKVGPRPYGIAVSQGGETVAIGVEDEEKVKFYALPEFKYKGETHIGKMFNDHIVLTKDGKHIMVANFYSDDVVGIDMNTMKGNRSHPSVGADRELAFAPRPE